MRNYDMVTGGLSLVSVVLFGWCLLDAVSEGKGTIWAAALVFCFFVMGHLWLWTWARVCTMGDP